MNTTYFTTTPAEYWRSSQRQVNDANKVWCTNSGGGVGNHPKTETISARSVKKFHVTAVRDVTPPTILPNHFINNGDGTCTLIQYTFIGNGNWSDAANWINNTIPPAILPAGSAIVINPVSNGQCILNVTQQIATGVIIKVNAGKNFVVQGALLMQ